METNKENDEIKLKEKAYTINSNKNNSFTLIIKKSNSTINIKAEYKEIFIHIFEKEMDINTLQKNKYLILCETIDEIYDDLITLLNENQTTIIEEDNKISINIPTKHPRIKEIIFTLEEEVINETQKVQDLIKYISTINKKLKSLEEENNNLKAKINEFEIYIPFLKHCKYIFDNKISNLNSVIIGNNDEYNIRLKNWINPNKKIKFLLLYKMIRDGMSFSTFHNLCDNKGPTVLLTQSIDGKILGMYNPLNWNSTGKTYIEPNMFAFSLTEDVKCMVNMDNNTGIYCHSLRGPYSYALGFGCDNRTMDYPYIYTNNIYYHDSDKLYPGNNPFIKVTEVEIFQVQISD